MVIDSAVSGTDAGAAKLSLMLKSSVATRGLVRSLMWWGGHKLSVNKRARGMYHRAGGTR